MSVVWPMPGDPTALRTKIPTDTDQWARGYDAAMLKRAFESSPPAPPEFVKHDTGKPQWSLLPWDAVKQIVAVLGVGAAKYPPRNWEQGADYSRYFDALQRHLTAWWSGERNDPESGLHHLAHAGCCLLFLLAYELRGVGKDDRK